MAREEAEQANIEADNRRRFFRVVNGKANLTLHNDAGAWRELVSMNLRNGDGGPDDHVGAVQGWAMPNVVDLASPEQLYEIRSKLGTRQWRESTQASAWAGYVVADVLGMDITDKGAKANVKRALDGWIKARVLKVETHDDSKRMPRQFIVPGEVE